MFFFFLFPVCRPKWFPLNNLSISWPNFMKLGLCIGNGMGQNPIYCRSGRMHRRHAPLTLMAKNTRNGGFRTFSDRVLDGSSPNLACGLVLPPYWTLLTGVPVGCTRVTHHWLWWLKTQETQVSAPFLTEFLMDHNQTWHVGWYHPTDPYLLPFRSNAHIMHEWVWAKSSSS